jgi:hypothetical protein
VWMLPAAGPTHVSEEAAKKSDRYHLPTCSTAQRVSLIHGGGAAAADPAGRKALHASVRGFLPCCSCLAVLIKLWHHGHQLTHWSC